MLKDYLIVERSALPDYFLRVVEARKLLESGACTQVGEAVQRAGISRSTYYKYRDKIIEPAELNIGQKATLTLSLVHEAGSLSRVLNAISEFGANILTITPSLPIHQQAGIMLSLDLSNAKEPVERLLDALQTLEGVERARLLAVE